MSIIESDNSQEDMFDENVIAGIALRRALQFRLNFWINICKNPVSHGNYYWNSSAEHRLIAMLALAASLDQIPAYLISENKYKNYFTVSMVRLLTHISERKIQRIIKTGIERGDIIVINEKNSQYQGTKQLLNLYKGFEKSWIDSQVDEIKLWKNNNLT
tara:strand:- start:448 stop:924 length:477 start_codon:yes stop_codon:yes gene_type:complete